MSTSVRKENRWRRTLQDINNSVSDRRREIEAGTMVRAPRPQVEPLAAKNSATRGQVRAWMRNHSHEYGCATHLAEAANVAFDLPGEGLDDEAHWIWEEAALAGAGGDV